MATTELADLPRTDFQGKSRADALLGVFRGIQASIARQHGRSSATTGKEFRDDGDPFLMADAGPGVLPGCTVWRRATDTASVHAIRTLRRSTHGFALIHASNGFPWNAEVDQSVEGMIQFPDTGLS